MSDLYIKINGVYVGFIRNTRTNTWNVVFDGCRIDEGFVSRADAEKFVSDLFRSKEKPEVCNL